MLIENTLLTVGRVFSATSFCELVKNNAACCHDHDFLTLAIRPRPGGQIVPCRKSLLPTVQSTFGTPHSLAI